MRNVLVISKGHPFDEDAFAEFLIAIPGVNFVHVEHPQAEKYLTPEHAAAFDVFLFYDMPGLTFEDTKVTTFEPSERYKKNLLRLLGQGKGMVFLHHAIAGWPTWPEYAEIIGARFLYQPTLVNGQTLSDSGYRHEVEYQAKCLQPDHPVMQGVPAEFAVTDELYLMLVDDAQLTPLLASDYSFTDQDFYSTSLAVAGQMHENQGWSHPKGSALIGWAKQYAASRIVYLQPGDGASAYENRHLQKLIANAVSWVA